MAANDQIDNAIGLETQRLATQALPSSTLVSQQGSAQADRVEIQQVISTSGVSSLAGTTNQIIASSATGAVTLSFPVSISITTSYKIAGTKVVGAQETGWTAATGTPNKGVYATYAGQTVSVGYVQAEAQQTDDKVKANSQRIKALEDAMRTHGLIN